MDRLTTMITFVQVVKLSSFTAAADELGFSKAVVSRHIADLEEHFGLRLLNRTTRSVTLTEAGQSCYDACQRVFAEIQRVEEELAAIKDDIEGEISVLCPVWVGNFDISEAMVAFSKAFPNVEIKLHIGEVSPNPHDFLAKGYDLCIQPNDMRDSDVIAKKVSEVKYILVASTEYLRERGDPKELKDLQNHDCLVRITDPVWSFANGERISMRVSKRFSSNSFFSLCTAALNGLGIAMLPRQVAAVEIDRGNLCQVLPNIELESKPLYAAYAPGGSMPRKIRALVGFMTDWFDERAQAPETSSQIIKLFDEGRKAHLSKKHPTIR